MLVPAPGAPSFLAFSEITSTALNVSWGEPAAANGILQGYRVVYEPLAPVQGKGRGRARAQGSPALTSGSLGSGACASARTLPRSSGSRLCGPFHC